MPGLAAAFVRAVRALYYCQNPSCAGQSTYAATCCGRPMTQVSG